LGLWVYLILWTVDFDWIFLRKQTYIEIETCFFEQSVSEAELSWSLVIWQDFPMNCYSTWESRIFWDDFSRLLQNNNHLQFPFPRHGTCYSWSLRCNSSPSN
jgi:hypothetical protein